MCTPYIIFVCTIIFLQEAQVTLECVIDHKHHRSILGPKGANVQAITSDHSVSIKFPDRAKQDAPPTAASGDMDSLAKDVILVTGRKENAEAAILALKVRHVV